jgi:two-component system, sensor histidine kinase PdtaS
VRRIRSIAIVHETLSRDAGEAVAFTEILRPLVQMVAEAVSSPDRRISFEVQGEAGRLPAEVATPMAVVLNELLQNAADHAFPADGLLGRTCRVVIELAEGPGEFVIRVVDNGVGVPPDFSIEAAKGLGLSIVRALVTSDLRGTIDVFEPTDGSAGTVVELRIPVATAT